MARINNSWQLLQFTFSKFHTSQKNPLHTEYFLLPRNKMSPFLTRPTFIFKKFYLIVDFTFSYHRVQSISVDERLESGILAGGCKQKAEYLPETEGSFHSEPNQKKTETKENKT